MNNSNAKIWTSLGALALAVVGTLFVTEGGYVNDPNDAGGEPNHGITVAVARDNGYVGPMKSMTQVEANGIYMQSYITRPGYHHVLKLSPAVGEKLVDFGVNAGPTRATRTFQSALSDLSRGGRDYPPPTIDGTVGPATLAAYAALEKRRGRVKACELTLKLMDGQQAVYYATLAKSYSNASFVVGWIDNRVGNVPLARCAESVATPSKP